MMAFPKIVYEDTAPGGAEKSIVTTSDAQHWCTPADMFKEINPPAIATLEDNYWVLGDKFRFLPDRPQESAWGWWTHSMSDANGEFETPPVIQWKLDDGYITTVGLTFIFDTYGPTYPVKIAVQWYRDDVLLSDKEYEPDSYTYSVINDVAAFNKVVVTVYKMSAGYRYLKVPRALYGIVRTFTTDELESVAFYQAVDLISDRLEVSDLTFTLRNKAAVPFNFQRRQQLAVYHGDNLLGVRYITKSQRLAMDVYKITAQDLLGVLSDSGEHYGGLYTGQPAEEVVADILGDIIDYDISEDLKSIPVYGWLPIADRIGNLQQVLFAIGACASTARAKVLKIFKALGAAEREPVSLAGRSFVNPEETTDKIMTSVELTEHSYTADTQEAELYSGVLSGNETIRFSEPVHSLKIAGGTIAEQGANYAVISGAGANVTLTGLRYAHTTRVLTMENIYVSSAAPRLVKTVTDAYLIGAHNGQEALQRYYDYAVRNTTVKTRIKVIDDEAADFVQLEQDFHDAKAGHIVSMDIGSLSKNLVADITVLLEVEEV